MYAGIKFVLLKPWCEYQRHNRKECRQRGGERKTYNVQASSTAAAQFWNPHHLVTSFLCCTELQIQCAQIHSHTRLQVHTRAAQFVHTLVAYARVSVYPKRSHKRFVGEGFLGRLRFTRERDTQQSVTVRASTFYLPVDLMLKRPL